jgi:hypothetical protein
MSIEEQDQILGRLTRLRSDSFRTVNMLGVKVQELSAALAGIAKELRSNDLLGPDGLGPEGTIAAAIRAAHGIPDRQVVLDTLVELQAEMERYNDLRIQLDRFNTPVQ